MRVLLIENDKAMSMQIKDQLKADGHITDMAFSFQAGLDLALENTYQFIILSGDGDWSGCRWALINIRVKGIKVPIMVIGSKMTVSMMSEFHGYGADDFLMKPVTEELLALRLKVMTKRKNNRFAYYRLADIEFSPERQVIKGVDGEVKLTRKEAQLLELLVINQHQTLSRLLIEERLWTNAEDLNDNLIEVHISNLRKKIRQMTELLTIDTVRNAGYAFKVEDDPMYSRVQ